MKRSLRIFALLVAASMIVMMVGCGEDEELDPMEVKTVSVAEGATIAGNSTITVSFSNALDSADIQVSGAAGTTAVSGKTATWTPTGDIPPGAHTLSGSGTDADGQSADIGPVNFTAAAADNEAPTLDDDSCDPKNGADGVDPADYPESIFIALSDNIGVTEAKIVSRSPEFNYTEELGADGLTVNFLKYNLSNEETIEITVMVSDAAGN
jgi:hypothetical protein